MKNILQKGQIKVCDDSGLKYYVEIISIEEKYHPYVGIKSLLDGTIKSVEVYNLRSILTNQNHLEKLGFKSVNRNGFGYFLLGDLIISGIQVILAPGEYFFSGPRLVPKLDFLKEAQNFFKNADIDRDGFDKAYPDLNEINGLVDLLVLRGLFHGKIEDVLEKL